MGGSFLTPPGLFTRANACFMISRQAFFRRCCGAWGRGFFNAEQKVNGLIFRPVPTQSCDFYQFFFHCRAFVNAFDGQIFFIFLLACF